MTMIKYPTKAFLANEMLVNWDFQCSSRVLTMTWITIFSLGLLDAFEERSDQKIWITNRKKKMRFIFFLKNPCHKKLILYKCFPDCIIIKIIIRELFIGHPFFQNVISNNSNPLVASENLG